MTISVKRNEKLKWRDLLFRENGNVLIDAKLAENLSKKVTVGEVGFERVDHLKRKNKHC